LIPQGVKRSVGRARAAYTEQSLVFQDSIQAIAFPLTEQRRAKLLTAILNSSLAAWVYFHDTANLGTDRAKIHQEDLLKLPFDRAENMPDPDRAKEAEEKIVALVDAEIARANELLSAQTDILPEVDRLVFAYYGLDEFDVALIDDTFRYIIPAMQPRRSAGLQKIWTNSALEDRRTYALMLCRALELAFREPISASLAALSSDVAVLKLTIGETLVDYCEDESPDLTRFLDSIGANLPIALPGNVQVVPDLRFVIGTNMYLVKPLQLRHWLRSTALADAEQIAAEFSAAVARGIGVGAVHADG
jgi:hypothetical protein